ncbi:MAG TPA: adenylate/guanylate cyclase domain-containing protein, partial [Phenylobacterium sp.]
AAMAARGIAIGETRIGAHYGEAVVGNFGSRRRVQYTAMGDAMNLAARLESANKQLGTELIASGALVDAAGWTQARDLGAIVVKGRREPVRIFQLDVRLSDADIEAHRARLDRLRDGRREDVDAGGDPALVAFLARVDKVGPEGVWALDSK